MFKTPILFIIYKNPNITKAVFEKIKEIKPRVLYINSDGPKSNNTHEINEIAETRRITEIIDWDCTVHRRYLETNLGCKLGVSSAINWFFENEEYGIILEYDCLPDLSFFHFCENLLEKYRYNSSVYSISGNNFDFILQKSSSFKNHIDSTYTFSNLSKIWGWATWKRAWKNFDITMSDFPHFINEKKIESKIFGKKNQKYWLNKMKDVFEGRNNSTWGFIWLYTLLNNDAYCITPNVNLVSNIGFGIDATHAKDDKSIFSNIEAKTILNIEHPKEIILNKDSDARFSNYLRKSEYKHELILKLKNLVPQIIKDLYKEWK
uniref:nucleotide-diphospho-sugar transferase n=1 Tax=Algoriphagus sp. TaxID=1872435 RepID=UPI004047AA7D